MWLTFTFLAFSSVAAQGQARSDSLAPRIEAFLKQCENSRQGAIAQLEHTLRGLQSQNAKTREVARRITNTQEELRVLKAKTHLVVPTLAFPPEVGAIGRLPGLSCHVDQILSQREM